MADAVTFDGLGLRTLASDADVPPDCRMTSAHETYDLVQRYIDADERRAKKRALVDGLVDGNPPQNPARMRDAGLAPNTNVNWGTGASYLSATKGAYYDLGTEAPGTVAITVGGAWPDEKCAEWGEIMSRHADYEFMVDRNWDLRTQLSAWEMTLHGTGPFYWDDPHTVFPEAIATRQLLVDDMAKCETDEWESAAILFDYYPPRLYRKIVNEDTARDAGWRPQYTKLVIARAMPIEQRDGQQYDWEYYQNLLKTSSFGWTAQSDKVCKLAHVFWREFNNRITHSIIERTNVGGDAQYLYLNVGRYASFSEIIHPMYFDQGREGLHYNVTGLGVKMYGPMRLENAFLCRLFDAGMMPKTLFVAKTEEAYKKFQAVQLGDGALIKPGVEVTQNPINGMINEGLTLVRTSRDLLSSNLSQYRQPVAPDKPGNPATKYEKQMEAAQASSLSNTNFARHYKQLDHLYSEIVRRLANLNSSDDRAKRFQRKCIYDGVPREAFGRIERVEAVRVMGQGSPFMRQQIVGEVLQVVGGGLPENGRQQLVNDFIASRAGQAQVRRWNPAVKESAIVDDQRERASNQIGNMQQGIPAVVSPSQNPITFAGMYIISAQQAIQSVQKGGNPRQVVRFLDTIGPAIGQQVQRLKRDPLRAAVVKDFEGKLATIAKATDQLKKMLAKQQQQDKAQQGKAQGVMSDQQIAAMKVQGDLKLKAQKQQAVLAMQARKHQQQMALADASTASQVKLNHYRALNNA